jgi:hypothetical protein
MAITLSSVPASSDRRRGTYHPCRKLDSHAAQVTLRNALSEFRGRDLNRGQLDYAGSSDDRAMFQTAMPVVALHA